MSEIDSFTPVKTLVIPLYFNGDMVDVKTGASTNGNSQIRNSLNSLTFSDDRSDCGANVSAKVHTKVQILITPDHRKVSLGPLIII